MRYKILGLILIVFVLIAGSLFLWQKSRLSGLPAKGLADKNRMLTADQQKIYIDKIQKAEKYLVSINPTANGANMEKANTYVFIGQQYFGLGQLEKSKNMYSQALLFDSENEQALAGLGLTFSEAEDYSKAEESYQKITEINPKNSYAWINLIQLKEKQQVKKEDIEALYNTALEKTNKYIDVITKYAQFEEQAGNRQRAIDLWQQAIVSNPEGAKIYQAEVKRLKDLN